MGKILLIFERPLAVRPSAAAHQPVLQGLAAAAGVARGSSAPVHHGVAVAPGQARPHGGDWSDAVEAA